MANRSHVSGLTRSPVAAETVRVATVALDCAVEFVLIEPNRAVVVAANGPLSMQPRTLHQAEQRVLDGEQLAVADDGTAAAVTLEDAATAALYADAVLEPGQLEILVSLARLLSEGLRSGQTELPPAATPAASILSGLRDLVIVIDPNFVIRWCNEAVVTLLGWVVDDVVGRSAADFIHPDDIAVAVDRAVRLTSGQETYRVRLRLRDALNNWVPVSITGLDHSANPDLGGLVLSIRNDEGESEADRVLDRTQRVSTTILDNLTDAVVATDGFGVITIINSAARRLFGIADDLPITNVTRDQIVVREAGGDRLPDELHPLSPTACGRSRDLAVRTDSGFRYFSVTSAEVPGPEHDQLGVVATFHDTTQARSDARKLRDRALHDQLTGLANRRHLTEQLTAISRDGGEGRIAACFVDLDRFKNVNDVHGHRIGDALLQAAASRLRSIVRHDDILARPGGDEFVVVLVDPDHADRADDVAVRIRDVLGQPYEVDGTRLHLTASVGVVTDSRSNLDPDRLLQNADIALYAAKGAGRDRAEVFDQQLARATEIDERQRSLVQDTLDHDRLTTLFQPIVDSDGRTLGLEALARCRTSSGTLVEPADFLRAIDGTPLIERLDRHALAMACRGAARLAESTGDTSLYVACNFSATTLGQSNLAEIVMAAIGEASIAPHQLCIEVTETAAFEAGVHSIRELTRLRDAGVRIALDDFGTGYSSLSHLRNLPLHTVKMDRSFIAALDRGGSEVSITAAITELARALGLDVVAEGVENKGQLDAALDLGIATMQGWLYSHAIPLDDLLDVLITPDGRFAPSDRGTSVGR